MPPYERIVDRLPSLAWGAVLVAVVVVPAALLPWSYTIFDGIKLTLLYACAVVGGGAWLAWRVATRASMPRPRMAVPLLVFVALLVIATVTSVNRSVAIFGLFGRDDGLLLLLCVIVFGALVVLCTWRDPARLRSLAIAIVIGATVDALLVVLQRCGVAIARVSGSYPSGTIGNSDFAGAHFAMALPLALYLRTTLDRVPWRRGMLALACGLGLGIIVSGTRGGLLAALIGIAVMGALDATLLHRFVTWSAGALAAVGAAVIVFVALSDSVSILGPFAHLPYFHADTLTGAGGRVTIWGVALAVIAGHPLIGTGPGTFALVSPPHTNAYVGAPLAIDEPHNIALAHGVSAGLPGLVTFVAIVVLLWVFVIRARKTTTPRPVVGAFGGAFAAYLAQGWFSIDAPALALLGWVCAGSLVALADPALIAARARGPKALETPSRSLRSPWWSIVIAVTTAGLVVVAALPTAADVRLQSVIERFSHGNVSPDDAMVAFDDLLSLDPTEPDLKYLAAYYTSNLGTHEEVSTSDRMRLLRYAQRRLDEATTAQPHRIVFDQLRGKNQGRLAVEGDANAFADGDATFAEAAAYDPANPGVRAEWAVLLANWAVQTNRADLRSRALEQAGRATSSMEGWPEGLLTVADAYRVLGENDKALAAIDAALALRPGWSAANAARQRIRTGA